MHIRYGILSPDVCLVTGLVSLAAVTFSLRKLRTDLDDRAVPLTGMLAAVVFAGQMVNFPLFGLPVSGHLLGGVLSSAILGPWAGCLAMTLVLIVQAVLFNDGGLISLGANILNMAVIGCWGGFAVYSAIRKLLGDSPRTAIPASIMAAWLSVLGAAALFCFEFACSHGSNQFSLRGIFSLMVLYHALIGVGEALITGGILSFVLARRPDLIASPHQSSIIANFGQVIVAGLMFALATSAFLAPLKSEHPDGLDRVSEVTGIEALKVERDGLILSDYEVPISVSERWSFIATSLAGLLGTLVVFTFAIVLGRTARWNLSRVVSDSGHAA